MSTDAFSLSKSDTFVCNLSLDSIAGKMMIIRAIELNSKLILLPVNSKPLASLKKFIEDQALPIDKFVFAFVPLQVQYIKSFQALLKRAKVILIGGAGLSAKGEAELSKVEVPIYATYGMTETITHIAIRPIGKGNQYIALPNVELKLSEQQTLRVKSPSTGDLWLTTNDLVEMDKKGKAFKLLGRADNVINSGGLKIQLEQVEHKILEVLDKPLRMFCFGLPDNILGTKLCCAYEKNGRIELNKEQLKGKLPKFVLPKDFFPLAKFKYTPSGKIDKLKTIDAYISPKVSNK